METDTNDPIRYDQWIEDALRSVIRKALIFTSENGLVGEHHFYITFRTNTDLVTMPPHMLAQHPEEMTIVLQHQFTDLDVTEEGFSVSLRFSGKPEFLSVPFSEVTGFSDPSVNFGLQLKTMEMSEDEIEDLEFPMELPDKNQDLSDEIPATFPGDSATKAKKDNGGEPQKSGEVIALDAFRKK